MAWTNGLCFQTAKLAPSLIDAESERALGVTHSMTFGIIACPECCVTNRLNKIVLSRIKPLVSRAVAGKVYTGQPSLTLVRGIDLASNLLHRLIGHHIGGL